MLIVGDEQCRRRPQRRVRLDRVVDRRDEAFSLEHVVVGVLIGRDHRAAVAVVIAEVGLDERVLRQRATPAVVEELIVGPEELRLVLQQVHDLHGRTLLVVVVNLRGVPGVLEPLIDALELLVGVEELHPDVPEGRPVMRERAVAQRRAGDRREPSVEDRVLERERGDDRQLLALEVIHDLPRVLHVPALLEVAADEPLHGGGGPAVEDLPVDRCEIVVWIRIELALVLRQRGHGRHAARGVRVALRAGQAVDPRVDRLQRTQQMVERAVLHHQDDDVLE